MNFNLGSLRVLEDVGVVNNTVYIELEGSAELPLIVELQMSTYHGELIRL